MSNRLTHRLESGLIMYIPPNGDKKVDFTSCGEHSQIILNRLAELEDKMGKALMIEMPCNVGDTVYEVCTCTCYMQYPNKFKIAKKGEKAKCLLKVPVGKSAKGKQMCAYISKLAFTENKISKFGKDVFLTQGEALAELERRKVVEWEK